jgi:aspartyl-tRNA(Asn)/glutamyl-tRNA(Gln) amidotransferase subunit B
MSDYKATIGLEIHAELKTLTKMFCNSKNDPDEKRPNVNICPVCMAYPGTLPTVNFEAVKHVVRVGCAINGQIADYSEFDRKNYFYPDIPKGYQISQYKFPLVKGGMLNGVKITRVHLEEDTARSSHDQGDYSLVDFNRAGVPLMELVTEPVIHTGEEASAFAKELQLLLQALGAGEANMEKGEMRVEANISISPITNDELRMTNDGKEILGTKVEVKNLNSFKAVEKAIAYEIERHKEILEKGEKLVQETRGWDENKEVTFSQRAKEDSHDYRYFPDPDIPKMKLSEVPELNIETIMKSLPELPWNKRERLAKMGLKAEDAEVFVRYKNWAVYFDALSHSLGDDAKKVLLAVNYLTSDLAGLIKNDKNVFFEDVDIATKISAKDFASLVTMASDGVISSRATKDILKVMYENGGDPEELANKLGLIQKSDEGELKAIAQKIIGDNPKVVAEYKSGKTSVIQFFVGQGMKATKGSGNPAVLKTIFEKLLS